MPVSTATVPAKSKKSNGVASNQIRIRPIKRRVVKTRIVGVRPLIQHAWSKKAKAMMRDKHQGKKTKVRDARDPQEEGREAAYRTGDGRYGIPLNAIKGSLITAAHKDLGIEKTLVKKSLFIRCSDPNGVLPMECSEPVIQEDAVRVGQGSTDLRYRPYFHRWSVDIEWEIDAELLTTNDLCVLIDRAGFGVGIGEWRPETGGEYGRFELDTSSPIEEKE